MFNINLTDDTVLRQMGELNKCNKELLEINNDLLKTSFILDRFQIYI